jgi:1,2-phenylacetyl-CoA epoxidase catalytic subunit
MLTSHAYREKLAAERFSDALRLLPLYESEEYWRNVIEEEEEHYRGCLAVAKEVGIDLAPLVDSRLLMAPEGIPAFHTWLDVLLAHAFNDKAGYYVLIGLKGSKVGPYARLAEDILVEEDAHGIAGASALVNFYASQIESEERGQALLKHLDAAVWCLGRPGTRGDADAVRLGLKTRSSSDTLREFCSYVDAMLVKLDRHDLIPIIKRYQQ